MRALFASRLWQSWTDEDESGDDDASNGKGEDTVSNSSGFGNGWKEDSNGTMHVDEISKIDDFVGGLRDRRKDSVARLDGEEGCDSPLKGVTDDRMSSKAPVLAFGIVLCIMIGVVFTIPSLSSVDGGDTFFWRPSKVEHFKHNKDLLILYRDQHGMSLLLGMSSMYILMQTFCVPGSGTTLNLLAGCIYSEYIPQGDFLIALPYCIICSTIGAVMCYTFSSLTARDWVLRKFPARIAWLRQKVSELEASSQLLYFLSLRLTPIVPAWFLNIAAPMTPIPVRTFALATAIGCTPSSLFLVQTGAAISNLEPGEDIFKNNSRQLLLLMVLAIIVFAIPVLLKRRMERMEPELANSEMKMHPRRSISGGHIGSTPSIPLVEIKVRGNDDSDTLSSLETFTHGGVQKPRQQTVAYHRRGGSGIPASPRLGPHDAEETRDRLHTAARDGNH